MSETTHLIISIQGKSFAGKTELAQQVIGPAIRAIGGTVTKTVDNKGVFLTVSLPLGCLAPIPEGGLKRIYSQLEFLEKCAVPKMRRASFDQARTLLTARDHAEEFLAELQSGTVTQLKLPAIVQEAIPKVVLTLTEEVTAAIERINVQLVALGFDIPAKPR